MPEGYRFGETLYFIGSTQVSPDGDKMVHGQQCVVMGPAAPPHEKTALLMQFTDHESYVKCIIENLSSDPPVQ